MKKWIYIAATVAVLALMGAAVAEGFIIKSKSAQINTLTAQTSQQAELIKKLSEMEAVSLNIRFEVKNTAVFGAIKNGDYQPILEGSLNYLRKELIKSDTFAVSKTVEMFRTTKTTGKKALYPSPQDVEKIKIK